MKESVTYQASLPESCGWLASWARAMKESVTYQAILEEGRVQGIEEGREEVRADEARRILLAQRTKRFGKSSAKIRKTVAAISERAVLEGLATRLLEVDNWTELLAGLKLS